MRQCITKKLGSALLMSAMLLALLPGCAADTSEPVFTEDDLTPSSTVQEVLEQDFTYFWIGDAQDKDPERFAQIARNTLQYQNAKVQAVHETLQQTSLTDEQRESAEAQLKEYETEAIGELQEMARAQLAFDPVLSPQEAANRAGQLMEECYGLDLTDTEFFIQCYQPSPGSSYYNGRLVWEISALHEPLVILDPYGGNQEQTRAYCTLDATTGELVSAIYCFTEQEYAAMESLPASEAFLPQDLKWDTQNPAYAEASDTVQQQLILAFSGSMMADGARVTDAEPIEGTYTPLAYRLRCDNGRTYDLMRDLTIDRYTACDFDGYPLRSCLIRNEAYWQ